MFREIRSAPFPKQERKVSCFGSEADFPKLSQFVVSGMERSGFPETQSNKGNCYAFIYFDFFIIDAAIIKFC